MIDRSAVVNRVRPFLENSTACTMFNANFLNPVFFCLFWWGTGFL